MKYKLKANPVGQVYFKKDIREQWGDKYELQPNLSAGVIYPEGTPPERILASLEVIRLDLEHQVNQQEKPTKK